MGLSVAALAAACAVRWRGAVLSARVVRVAQDT
ncbi:MAG: hypothetical protein FD126_2631, partial [Elusimicrobia bacterium]